MSAIAKKRDYAMQLRLPRDLRDRLEARAASSGRSMNSEIIEAIERHLEGGGLLARVERLERMSHQSSQ